jgi:hypothetical protein
MQPEFTEFGLLEEHTQKEFWRHARGQIPVVGIFNQEELQVGERKGLVSVV